MAVYVKAAREKVFVNVAATQIQHAQPYMNTG